MATKQAPPTAPVRDPLIDTDGNMTRSWVLYFNSLKVSIAAATPGGGGSGGGGAASGSIGLELPGQ